MSRNEMIGTVGVVLILATVAAMILRPGDTTCTAYATKVCDKDTPYDVLETCLKRKVAWCEKGRMPQGLEPYISSPADICWLGNDSNHCRIYLSKEELVCGHYLPRYRACGYPFGPPGNRDDPIYCRSRAVYEAEIELGEKTVRCSQSGGLWTVERVEP